MTHEFGIFHGHVCHFGYQVSIWDLTPDRGNIPEMRLVVLNCFEVFFPNH